MARIRLLTFAILLAGVGLSGCGGGGSGGGSSGGDVSGGGGTASPENTPPTVAGITPANGAVGVVLNTTVSATFSEPMNNATLNAASFTLAPTAGGPAVAGVVSVAGNTATLTPGANLAASTQYTATITTDAQDTAGNALAAAFSWSFTTVSPDITPPTVLSTSPVNGAVGVALNATVSASFSEPMKNATLNAASFTLAPTAGGPAVAGAVNVAGNTATFTPGASLAANTQYTATISTAAQDVAGNALVAPVSWNFTTAAPDLTPPTVLSTSPVNGAAGVVLNTVVSATFSEPMNNATLNAASFTLAPTAGGPAVAGVVSVAGNTATLTPGANLVASTQYTATITTAARDVAGNALAAPFSWNFTTGAAAPVPLACSTPVAGPPALSVAASRTSGVAPLAVFFDATGTTSPATLRPFHDIEYMWDFDDAAGGAVWSTTGLSKKLATGPVAAHVFESAGTYNVVMTAFDGTNTASCTVQITVTDPNTVFAGNNTLCIGATSLPSPGAGGCPAGALALQQPSFNTAVAIGVGAGIRRLLFKRGDTFTSTADAIVAVTGPGIVGAFGAGASPSVNITGNNKGIRLSDQDTPGISDWRIMDLEFNGNSGVDTEGVFAQGGMNQVTLLRLNVHHVGRAFGFSPFVLDAFNGSGHPGHTLWDQLAIVDSTASTMVKPSGGNGAYIGARRFAFMGNVVSDSTAGEHIIRTPVIYKGVLSNNHLSNPASAKHVVKMQAAVFGVSPTPFTEQVVFSDNKTTAGTGAAWTVAIGPQDDVSNEAVKTVIVERNWFAPHPGQQVALIIWAQDVTVRNNLFDLTGTSDHRGSRVDRRGVEPAPANVHFYNNTFYSNSTGNFLPIGFVQGAGMIARNNLGYAPNSTSRDMISGTATDTNNTSDANILVSPSFVSATPSAPADFGLGAASNALNQGTAVPVFSDFFRVSRPRNGGFDQGMMERP